MAEVSPDVLDRLAELIKATGAAGASHGPSFLDYLKGITDFLNAVAWPVAAVIGMLLFRKQIIKFIGDVEVVKLFGAELSRKLKQSADEAGSRTGLSAAPSQGELARSEEIAKALANADVVTIARQAEELAAEYERVRSSMFPGDPRTRKMEMVVAKMRTFARVFYPLRQEFAASVTPGKRLMAIAALQVVPDFDMLEWLALRPPVEKPFVGYHALVALLLALRTPAAKSNLPAIERAVETARSCRAALGRDTDRILTLDEIEQAFAALKRG